MFCVKQYQFTIFEKKKDDRGKSGNSNHLIAVMLANSTKSTYKKEK